MHRLYQTAGRTLLSYGSMLQLLHVTGLAVVSGPCFGLCRKRPEGMDEGDFLVRLNSRVEFLAEVFAFPLRPKLPSGLGHVPHLLLEIACVEVVAVSA